MLRDTSDPDRGFYLTLCLNAFLRMSCWFSFARNLVPGVLSMAVRHGRMNVARALEVYRSMPKDGELGELEMGGLDGDCGSGYMVLDFELAVDTVQDAVAS